MDINLDQPDTVFEKISSKDTSSLFGCVCVFVYVCRKMLVTIRKKHLYMTLYI